MLKSYLRGIGILTGMIFGAGVFALPYAFARAGAFWGLIHFVSAFLIICFLHLWYGEVAYFFSEKHRITGYAEKLLGNKAKHLVFITSVIAYYGSLVVYGLLGGIFLSNLFKFWGVEISAGLFSVLFFAVGGLLILTRLKKLADINLYLVIPLFAFTFYLFFRYLGQVNFSNFTSSFDGSFLNFKKDWFLPYGVWFFSLSGFSALPEVKDLVSGVSLKKFKLVILSGICLCALAYMGFIFSIFGVSGNESTPDALLGLAEKTGSGALILGSLIGIIAVFTSYIALALDMKDIYKYDYNLPEIRAWFLAAIPPVLLYWAGVCDFVKTLSLIGAFGMGCIGIFIILMNDKLHKNLSQNREIFWKKSLVRKFLEYFVLAGVLSGVVYELVSIF